MSPVTGAESPGSPFSLKANVVFNAAQKYKKNYVKFEYKS